MPARMYKLPNGKYRVETPNGVRAKETTEKNAKRQMKLLNAVEHGWRPSKGKK